MALDPIPMLAKAQAHSEECSGAPVATQGAGPTDIGAPSSESHEEAEVLQASIKAGSVAQIVVAAVAVLGLIYILKLVLITTLTSLLLAFVLEPLVSRLCRLGLSRPAVALITVVAMVALGIGLTFFFYSRAVDFATALPKYSGKVRDTL